MFTNRFTNAKAGRQPATNSINGDILRAVLSVGAAGVVVKLVAMAKEIAVAGVYGRSDVMDAFLAAAIVPSLLVNLVSESMNQALIPTLIRVREREGHERAQQLFSNAMLATCLLLACAAVAVAPGAQLFFPLITEHFDPAKRALSMRLFYWMLLVVPMTGIATNAAAVLNTQGRFALPALAPIAISMGTLFGAILLGGRFGIWAMLGGMVTGTMLYAVLVVWMLQTQGYHWRLHWYGRDQATRDVGHQYGAVLASGLVASGGLLVDQAMAAMLAAGSLSALVYANRFVSVVLALSGGAVSTSLTPYFSRLVARGDWCGCRSTLRFWTALTALVSIPVTAVLVGGAHGLVALAFQRGAFGSADTDVVARVLAMFALQIPFFVTSRVFYRFLVAMRRTDLVLSCGILNLVIDVVLNIVLMRWLGVAGIALATSLWTVSTFLFLGYWAGRLLAGAEASSAIEADGLKAARSTT
jgi:putative peptidoglycan lipid II flippase